MCVWTFVAFWQHLGKPYIWEENCRKIKVILGWWHFLFNMRKDFLINNGIMVLCKIYYLQKWRKNSSSDVVLYRYLFQTQAIGFEMIRVSSTPKYLKGPIGPDLKICWVAITRVCSFAYTRPVRFFFYYFEMEKKALILIYNTLVTKIIFFKNQRQKTFWPACFL